ncbi:glycogen debranching N-terminal domain-containing protein [Streptomyces sp. NPDC059688]|uniref:glycogen debranching N-terminal domain-containing protein n=1 Tax=Streptomyces sp. NPDC059688 TaxID=3346906 RepID=UPI0036B5CCC2
MSGACVSGASGDLEAEAPQGLFFRDVRVIPGWQVRHGKPPPRRASRVPERRAPARRRARIRTRTRPIRRRIA